MAVDRFMHTAETEAEHAASQMNAALRHLEAQMPPKPAESGPGISYACNRGNGWEPIRADWARYYASKELLTKMRSARSRLASLERELVRLRDDAKALGFE